MMKLPITLFTLGAIFLLGCDTRDSDPVAPATTTPAVPAAEPPKSSPSALPMSSPPTTIGGFEINREYDITSKADLHDGPGDTFEKKINQKASDILKEIRYMSVDTSVTVKVLQVNDDWVEIQITQPAHLSSTHRGWIPKDCIQGGTSSTKLDGWIKHTARVYQGKVSDSHVVGYLSPPASVGIADDGSGWLRLIHGPIKSEGSNRFIENPDFESGLYIEAKNFTTVIPGNWGK